jgi:hypothetical protein
VVLICASLMISYIEHLFICFLGIFMSSLEKYLFKYWAHYLKIIIITFCNKLITYLGNKSFSKCIIYNFLSHSLDFLKLIFIFCFPVQKLFSLHNLVHFCFVVWGFIFFLLLTCAYNVWVISLPFPPLSVAVVDIH